MTAQLRPLALLVAAVLTVGLAACGQRSTSLHGDTEAVYLDLGSLKYQVQLSRQLNPSDPEDVSYLTGLSPSDARLAPNQSWFAVWMLVENHTGQMQMPSQTFSIVDTQGNTYQPVTPDATNRFVYRPLAIAGHGQIPDPSSAAFSSPTQGAVILFKVTEASYDNRPLVLSIADPTSTRTATVDLDV